MTQSSFQMKVKVAWWVLPYIKSVALFAAAFGVQPDLDKVARTALRGISVVAR